MKQRTEVYGDLNRGRLADQGRNLRNNNRGGGGGAQGGRFPDGQFDSFFPGEKAVWMRLCNQWWEQFVYDHESRQVVKVHKTWFQSTKHYHPRTKRSLICSAGPHRDQPCYADAIRNAHFDRMREFAEQHGHRPADEPPVGVSNQFSFSIVVMEDIYKVKAIDKKTGRPRLSKAGKEIFNARPGPFVSLEERKTGVKSSFGHRFHMSLGKTHVLQLLQFDEEMLNYCGHCATPMTACNVVCPDCEATYALPGVVGGEDLTEARQTSFNCTQCHYEGPMQPQLECSGCGDPEEGSLNGFEFRIKREKVGEKQSILKIVGVRMPFSAITDPEVRENAEKMVNNPLDLYTIFAPTPLADQQKVLGALCDGIDPRPRNRKNSDDAKSYEPDDASDEVDDEIPY